MLQIKKAEFITSLAEVREFEGIGLPQCAVAGRSNVGKSSLINSLCNRRNLAKSGQTPGVTRTINVFLINEAFHLVDLPGYGYAATGKERAAAWGSLMEGYLRDNPNLKGVLQLVDIRHEPTVQDKQMVNWLRHFGIPFVVIATKADKVARAHHQRQVAMICRTLVVQPWEVRPVSSQTGYGKDETLKWMEAALFDDPTV